MAMVAALVLASGTALALEEQVNDNTTIQDTTTQDSTTTSSDIQPYATIQQLTSAWGLTTLAS